LIRQPFDDAGGHTGQVRQLLHHENVVRPFLQDGEHAGAGGGAAAHVTRAQAKDIARARRFAQSRGAHGQSQHCHLGG